jgi:NO-binding membrane sensor protein with MHYT domain
MLDNFFQNGPIPADQLIGSYDLSLVFLSYCIACFASYIALDFTGKLRDVGNTGASATFWLMGGSIAMGAGIWSMHFIGMVSFSMSGMTMHYDLFWTGLSLLVAIIASSFALALLKNQKFTVVHFAIGGIILGLAIASMHYTGMEAMKYDMTIRYLPGLFFLSILIAIAASEAALWLAIKSNQVILKVRFRLKLISAAIMGLAICGMHYTGMAAAVFTMNPHSQLMYSLDPTFLSISVAAMTFVILGIAFFASTYKEAINQQQLDAARQLGMAEVSANVLHSVGNVLNSVNVSVNVINERVNDFRIAELNNLYTLIQDNKDNLGDFFTGDPRGIKIPDFLNSLAKYWLDEKNYLLNEIDLLHKNLQHIKDIISTQQEISKISGIEHLVRMNDILEEGLLIAGLDNKQPEIKIIKHYETFKPILIDKVKLLQIIVNLLSNAKDALKSSMNNDKIISVRSSLIENKTVRITISDTGSGISSKHINLIFVHGFTTKQSGHGFGLHTCALAANAMGGAMRAESEGLEKGATFILEVPYRTPKK